MWLLLFVGVFSFLITVVLLYGLLFEPSWWDKLTSNEEFFDKLLILFVIWITMVAIFAFYTTFGGELFNFNDFRIWSEMYVKDFWSNLWDNPTK